MRFCVSPGRALLLLGQTDGIGLPEGGYRVGGGDSPHHWGGTLGSGLPWLEIRTQAGWFELGKRLRPAGLTLVRVGPSTRPAAAFVGGTRKRLTAMMAIRHLGKVGTGLESGWGGVKL